jgi:hypothetical protein
MLKSKFNLVLRSLCPCDVLERLEGIKISTPFGVQYVHVIHTTTSRSRNMVKSNSEKSESDLERPTSCIPTVKNLRLEDESMNHNPSHFVPARAGQ